MKLLRLADKMRYLAEDWINAGGVFRNADRWTAVAFALMGLLLVGEVAWLRWPR